MIVRIGRLCFDSLELLGDVEERFRYCCSEGGFAVAAAYTELVAVVGDAEPSVYGAADCCNDSGCSAGIDVKVVETVAKDC